MEAKTKSWLDTAIKGLSSFPTFLRLSSCQLFIYFAHVLYDVVCTIAKVSPRGYRFPMETGNLIPKVEKIFENLVT